MSIAIRSRRADSLAARYAELASELSSLLAGEPDLIANLAIAASLIFHRLPGLNWAGFYLLRGGELVLGPFQGRPACVRIAVGRGVCGTAVARAATLVVDDVHAFPGHIACDESSQSELVVPLIAVRRILGVLDLDSPSLARFGAVDRAGCERLVSVLLEHQLAHPGSLASLGPAAA
jgi:L-methionine (R)-S-oxide reductase